MLLLGCVDLLHPAGSVRATHGSSRHGQEAWPDERRRQSHGQLAPTITTWRADGVERQGAPRGTEQRLGQLHVGRLQPASAVAWPLLLVLWCNVARRFGRSYQRSPGPILPLQRQIRPLRAQPLPLPPRPHCAGAYALRRLQTLRELPQPAGATRATAWSPPRPTHHAHSGHYFPASGEAECLY
jgi:hypothetical protein